MGHDALNLRRLISPHPRTLPCRSSSPTDSTRAWHARASRGPTTRCALCLSPHLALRTGGTHQPGRFVLQVSLALLAKDLGATPARSGSVASMSRLSASIAEHGSRLFLKISRSSSATATTAGDGTGGEATVSVEPEASAEAAQEHV